MKKALAVQMMFAFAMIGYTNLANDSYAKDGACTKGSSCTKESGCAKDSSCSLIDRSKLKSDLGNITLVDALDQKYFDRSHVKGSVNVPVSADANSIAQSLPNKEAKIVVYCMNTKCHASDAVAKQLTSLGYTHVSIYRAGLQDLISNGFDIEGTNPKEPVPPKTASK